MAVIFLYQQLELVVDAIASSVKGDDLSPKSAVWASVSLLIILAGVTSNYF